MNASENLAKLAEEYPLLYLNPDTANQDTYKQVVLKGEEPPAKSLAHYRGNPADRLDIMETPVGPKRAPTLTSVETVLASLAADEASPVFPEPQAARETTIASDMKTAAILEIVFINTIPSFDEK